MKARDIKVGDVIGEWRVTDVALLVGPIEEYVEYAPADPEHQGVAKILNFGNRPSFEVVLVKFEARPLPNDAAYPATRGDWFLADAEGE
jgi:hypothetical protein